MSKLASFCIGALVASLIAVLAMSLFNSTETVAAVSAPVASQSSSLELGLDGLPTESLKFFVDGNTCIAIPNVGVTCFCPCDEGGPCADDIVEVPAASYAVTNTASSDVVTSTSASFTSTVEVPSSDVSANDAPSDDTPPTGEPEPPASVDKPNPNKGPKGNNGLGNGVDPAPPGIDKQGKPQNDNPANPGDPQYKGSGSDGEPNGKGGKDSAPGQSKDKGKS